MVFLFNFFRNIIISIMMFNLKRKLKKGLFTKGLDGLLPKPTERKHVIIKVYKKHSDINLFLMKICLHSVEEDDCLIYEVKCNYFDLLWIPYYYENFHEFVTFDDTDTKLMLLSFIDKDFDNLINFLNIKMASQFEKMFLNLPKGLNLTDAQWLSILHMVRFYIVNIFQSFELCNSHIELDDKEYQNLLAYLNKGRNYLIDYFNAILGL